MITRRVFLSSALSAVALGSQQTETAGAAEQTTVQTSPGPLVWPVVTRCSPAFDQSPVTLTPCLTLSGGLERQRAW